MARRIPDVLDGPELPWTGVLDRHGVDRLLVALQACHGAAGRADIAPEVTAAMRRAAQQVAAAAALVPIEA
jgi:hypothetical protein